MKGEKGFDDAEGDMKEAEGDLKGDGQGQGQGEGTGRRPAGLDDRAEPARAARSKRRAARSRRCARARRACSSRCRAAASGGRGYRAIEPATGRRRTGTRSARARVGDARGALEGALNGGADVAERARQVLKNCAAASPIPSRPEEERDYLERLLKRD